VAIGEAEVLATDFAVRLSPPGGQNRDTLLARNQVGREWAREGPSCEDLQNRFVAI